MSGKNITLTTNDVQEYSWDNLIREFPEIKKIKDLVLELMYEGYTQADMIKALEPLTR